MSETLNLTHAHISVFGGTVHGAFFFVAEAGKHSFTDDPACVLNLSIFFRCFMLFRSVTRTLA